MAASELINSYLELASLRKETDTFLGYIKELEDYYTRLSKIKLDLSASLKVSDVAKAVDAATAAMGKFEDKAEGAAKASEKLVDSAKETAQGFVAEKKSIDSLSNSYDDLIKQSVELRLRSKELSAARKEADQAFANGTIGVEKYKDTLAKITSEEKTLAITNGDVNRALRNLGKESLSTSGSLNELRAQLNLSLQAFDRLSKAERDSETGKTLKKNINDLTAAISEEEKATKRFQRNVGNYPSLDELKIKLEQAVAGFNKLTDAEKRSGEGLAKADEINKLNKSLKDQEKNLDALKPKVEDYGATLEEAGTKFSDMAASLAAAGLGLIGIDSVGQFLSDSIDEFNAAEAAASRFNNILTNVGRTDVLDGLTDEANRLADTFKQLDNDDITEVFTQLVQYGKLSEIQIKTLTPVILNFAAQSGQSMSQAASTIIKALEGNGKALKEYGIDIKDAANTSEAFGLVMQQLAPKVEGAAKAFGDTTAGQVAQTTQSIANLKEEIGGKLQPILEAFYRVVNGGLNGIRDAFNFQIETAKELGDIMNYVVSQTVRLFTFNLDSFKANAAARKQAKIDQEYAIQHEKDFADAKRFSGDVAVEASKRITETVEKQRQKELALLDKSLASEKEKAKQIEKINKDAETTATDLGQKEISRQVAIRDASILTYNKLRDAGKASSAEGKRAVLDVERNVFIVRELKKAVEGLAIGGGDPNKPFSPVSKSNDDSARKQAEALAEAQEKADLESQKRRLQNEAAFQKEIVSITFLTIPERVKARQIQAEKEIEIAKVQAQIELRNKNITDKQREDIADQLKRSELSAEVERDNEILKIRAIANLEIQEDAKKTSAALDVIQKERAQKEIDNIKYGLESRTRYLTSQKDVTVALLEDEKNAKLKAAGTEEERQKIEQKFHSKRLQVEIETDMAILKVAVETQEKLLTATNDPKLIAEASAKIADLKRQIAELDGSEAKLKISVDQASIDETVSALQKIKESYDKIASVIGDAINASATTQKNAIQDQIDALDKQKQKDIEVANSSTLTAEEKANKIAIINARAQAQKEQLELRQRQIDQQRARFEKANAIASIILNTAIAVAADIKNPFKIAFDLAIGAAQLAIAVATPIPKFKMGKKSSYEGLGIVGDGGRSELIERADGSFEVTPDKPTLTYLKAKDKVHASAEDFINGWNKSLSKPQLNPQPVQQPGLENKEIIKHLKRVESAIDRKPVPYVQNNMNGVNILWGNRNGWSEWKQRAL